MEELSKQQLILLALLISFVTSLATGIFTVSLMSQAPDSVAQTINQVVERTIEKTVTHDAAVAGSSNQVSQASSRVTHGMVRFKSKDFDRIHGLGLILNSQGVIVADKSSIVDLASYEAVFPDGRSVPVSIIQSQLDGDIIFLAPTQKVFRDTTTFTPLIVASSTTIGQDVYSLSIIGTSTLLLGQGILTSTLLDEYSTQPLTTTIASTRLLSGSPLFNSRGEVMGIKMGSLHTEDGSAFYPISSLRSVVPSF